MKRSAAIEVPFTFQAGKTWSHGGITYQWNAWGLRDHEISLAPPPQLKRILILGGTAVFGQGLAVEGTAPRQLENLLAKAKNPPLDAPLEITNGGLWGYSPEEQWAFYEKEGFQIKPDILVWVCEKKKDGFPNSARVRKLLRMPSWFDFFSHSHLLVLAKYYYLKGEDDEDIPYLDLLRRAQRFARSRYVPFRFIAFSDQMTAVAKGDLEKAPGQAILIDEAPYRTLDGINRSGQKVLAEEIYRQVAGILSLPAGAAPLPEQGAGPAVRTREIKIKKHRTPVIVRKKNVKKTPKKPEADIPFNPELVLPKEEEKKIPSTPPPAPQEPAEPQGEERPAKPEEKGPAQEWLKP